MELQRLALAATNPNFDPLSDFLEQRKDERKLRRPRGVARTDTGMREIEALRRGDIVDGEVVIKEEPIKKVEEYPGDNNEEKYNRFYDPEVEFNRLVEANKVINQSMKEGRRHIFDPNAPKMKLDDSLEMFSRAFFPSKKDFKPPLCSYTSIVSPRSSQVNQSLVTSPKPQKSDVEETTESN